MGHIIRKRRRIAAADHPLEGDMESNTVLRVAGTSNPRKLAGAIAHGLRQYKEIEMVACGALAVNQAVKGICVARQYLEPDGYDLVSQPAFTILDPEAAEHRTAIRFWLTLSDRWGPVQPLRRVERTPLLGDCTPLGAADA